MDSEQDQASVQDKDVDLTRHMDEIAAAVSSITSDLAALSAKLTACQTALQRRFEDLSQHETALAEREGTWSQEWEQTRCELHTRAEELAAGEARLACREDAARRLQSTLAGVMQVFGVSAPGSESKLPPVAGRPADAVSPAEPSGRGPAEPAGECEPPSTPIEAQRSGDAPAERAPSEDVLAEDVPSADALPQDVQAGDMASEDVSAQAMPSEAVPAQQGDATSAPPSPDQSPSEPAGQVESARADASEAPAASLEEDRSSSDPEGDGTVAEAELDQDTRQKLKVLRRLTGGRVSDKELLMRISGEREGAAAGAPGSPRARRRWWSG